MNKTIGVIALQGGFASHIAVLESLGAATREVRTIDDLADCGALVIPGGESTVLTRHLMEPGSGYGTGTAWKPTTLFHAIREFALARPTMGTCAGLIMLARPCGDDRVVPFDVLDIDIERNAYGRQAESFTAGCALAFDPDGELYPATFIRAPKITRVGSGVEVLSLSPRRDKERDPILVRQKNILGLTFHPELTPTDTRIHEFFLSL